MAKYIQGKFKPTNPNKYKGDPTGIIYRSSWEARLMSYLDKHPDVMWWASEELVIPYISPVDGRPHRYFVDFVVKKRDGETLVIEVKPFKQTQEPLLENRLDGKGKLRRAYINEVATWGINKSKWKAAEEFCRKRGWRFVIMTEKDLNI